MYPGDHTPGRKARRAGGARAWMLQVREAAALEGNPDRSWGGGWWLRGAQYGPGRYPDSLQEEVQEGGGCLWGLEGEEVKKLGSRRRGNVRSSGGRKSWVRGAASMKGSGSCPGRDVARSAFRKDTAFLLCLLSRQASPRPEKLGLGLRSSGILVSLRLSGCVSQVPSPRSLCPTWAGHRDLSLEARASSLPCLTPRWPGHPPTGGSPSCWERGRGPQSRGHAGMGHRAGSSRSGAAVWVGEGLLGCSLFFFVNFYLDWFLVSRYSLLTSYPRLLRKISAFGFLA